MSHRSSGARKRHAARPPDPVPGSPRDPDGRGTPPATPSDRVQRGSVDRTGPGARWVRRSDTSGPGNRGPPDPIEGPPRVFDRQGAKSPEAPDHVRGGVCLSSGGRSGGNRARRPEATPRTAPRQRPGPVAAGAAPGARNVSAPAGSSPAGAPYSCSVSPAGGFQAVAATGPSDTSGSGSRST